MRLALATFIACLFVIGCGAPVPPPSATHAPTPSASPPTAAPNPTASPTLVALPPNVSGIPGAGDQTAMITPHSRLGEMELGVARNFVLGHCGLMSPIDIDGALWDPIGGHNGSGGTLTEAHVGELINATPTAIVLVDQNTMEMATPLGAVITLTRHEGPRAYFLCD